MSWKLAVVFAAGFLALSIWSFATATWPAAWAMLALALAWLAFGIVQLRLSRQPSSS